MRKNGVLCESVCGKATLLGGSASSLKRARPWVEEFVHFLTTHRGLGKRVDQRGILRKISSHGDSRMVGFAGR